MKEFKNPLLIATPAFRAIYRILIRFNRSIRRKIFGIAVGLVVLMVIASAQSTIMADRVGQILQQLTRRYIPAYADLASANIHSLQRALALRQMIISKLQSPTDDAAFRLRLKQYREADLAAEREVTASRSIMNQIVAESLPAEIITRLARLETRIENAVNDHRREVAEDSEEVIDTLEAGRLDDAYKKLTRIELRRDEFFAKIEEIRTEMLALVIGDSEAVSRDQREAIVVSIAVTSVAAAIGFIFAGVVASGITRPVHRLLEVTRQVEAGRLEHSIDVTTRDEIGQLSAAFGRMVQQLRHKERIREMFGRYIDPKVIEGLIDQPEVAGTQGRRRMMTIMFCDMRGFTAMSEGMTPGGLVKVINCYFSIMSDPIRRHQGIIDKYIGDAIMAYWGAPFVEGDGHAYLACAAALDMVDKLPLLGQQLPELLGVRTIPNDCDIRIGVATGEVLAGSIGSEFMMNFTVMGDAVNLASRLESANKTYGTRILVGESTAEALAHALELREIDCVRVAGQSKPQRIYEVMAKRNEMTNNQNQLRSHYAAALAEYRSARWDEAMAMLQSALDLDPCDGPSRAMFDRISLLRADPPPADWDGSWQIEGK